MNREQNDVPYLQTINIKIAEITKTVKAFFACLFDHSYLFIKIYQN